MGEVEGNRVELKFAVRAVSEIERGKRRWLKRRDKNPALFEEELAEALEQIKVVPSFGAPSGIISRGKVVRRVEMKKTRYQVYYREDSEWLVYVMCVWGGQRRTKPRLG